MKTAETPVGIFTINKVKIPSAYTCAAEQKIEYISENHMQIITMDQAVLFGNQLLSPRICQSCMNPDKITIYPLEIEYIGEKVLFTDHYSVKEWKKSDPLPEIHEWYPHIKKSRMQPVQELWKMLKLHTLLNDRNRMIGIVINRKQEYNISVKQYLSESNNLNGDKKWITENSANAIT